MGLFKKKEEKILPEDASKFQKLWHNKRTRALMILGGYFIFFAILIIFIIIANNNLEVKQEEETKITGSEKLEELNESDYEFEYNVIILDILYIFKGTKIDNEITGYKESPTELIKYVTEGTASYKVLGETKEEINLYENMNEHYFDLDYLETLLKFEEYEVIEEDNQRIYEYKNINIQDRTIDITLTIENGNIKIIDIIDQEDKYNLIFEIIEEVGNK